MMSSVKSPGAGSCSFNVTGLSTVCPGLAPSGYVSYATHAILSPT